MESFVQYFRSKFYTVNGDDRYHLIKYIENNVGGWGSIKNPYKPFDNDDYNKVIPPNMPPIYEVDYTID
jgi:hypothetical protein